MGFCRADGCAGAVSWTAGIACSIQQGNGWGHTEPGLLPTLQPSVQVKHRRDPKGCFVGTFSSMGTDLLFDLVQRQFVLL